MTRESTRPPKTFINFEIISANGEDEHGFNLYTPVYGDMFLGNFRTLTQAAREAIRLAGSNLQSINVI